MGRYQRDYDLEKIARLAGGTAMALLARNAGLKALGAGLALTELYKDLRLGTRARKRYRL